jgi:CxxH/CxxC protein (TIGR04129 family)
MIWYSCEEHIDYVMEDLIDQYQVAPILEAFLPSSDEKSLHCHWCKQTPAYQLIVQQEELHAHSNHCDR